MEHNFPLKLRNPRPQHWYDISYGRSDSNIALTLKIREETAGCELYIPDSKQLYETLVLKRGEIESKLPYDLEWMELLGKKASRIKASKKISTAPENWEETYQWLTEVARHFTTTFYEAAK